MKHEKLAELCSLLQDYKSDVIRRKGDWREIASCNRLINSIYDTKQGSLFPKGGHRCYG